VADILAMCIFAQNVHLLFGCFGGQYFTFVKVSVFVLRTSVLIGRLSAAIFHFFRYFDKRVLLAGGQAQCV
jgi:hypothetical protein